ncbi:class I lanthipeptide [Aquimarina sp. ERC-38]|nr:class I lanthipeptide [Aquimarina sp. ERC-38]UZO82176.1 class I lanthipeptide [Aquimarina sp. ERC-38]
MKNKSKLQIRKITVTKLNAKEKSFINGGDEGERSNNIFCQTEGNLRNLE